MKFFALSLALSCALLSLTSAHADEKKEPSRAWLDSRGIITLPELEKTLDTRFTPEERTKMEALLAERNAALTAFNERVSQVVREKLAASEAQVAARVAKKSEDDKKAAQAADDATKEAAELERIRRRQPSRYQAIMNQKKKAAEDTPKENTPKDGSSTETPQTGVPK